MDKEKKEVEVTLKMVQEMDPTQMGYMIFAMVGTLESHKAVLIQAAELLVHSHEFDKPDKVPLSVKQRLGGSVEMKAWDKTVMAVEDLANATESMCGNLNDLLRLAEKCRDKYKEEKKNG